MNLKELIFVPNLKSVKFYPVVHTSGRHLSQETAKLCFSFHCSVYQIHRILFGKVHDLISLFQKEIQATGIYFSPSKVPLFLYKDIQRCVITILYQ